MSGGSQHNPNGRQAPLGPAWNPLQLQMASYLARAPQAHLASERGVTWHTPTPPPRLYHVPAPSPPEPMQGLKVPGAGGSAVYRHTATPPELFRHSATPPELFRHTPTPPDKHMHRHTPSPGDVKAGAMAPVDLYAHLGQQRDKLVRAEDMLYSRGVNSGGVDLSVARGAGAPAANGAPLSLSVRDAPTINSLIARAQPRHPPHHARVDQLLERLIPSPVSPHSVIMHSRAAPTPSPPSSNEDSADSCGAPPGSKRKRKPERTVRMPAAHHPLPHAQHEPLAARAPVALTPPPPQPQPRPGLGEPVTAPRLSPAPHHDAEPVAVAAHAHSPRVAVPAAAPASARAAAPPLENGDAAHDKTNGPDAVDGRDPTEPPRTRRKTRSGSAETIDDIAAMIASTDKGDAAPPAAPASPGPRSPPADSDTPATVDNLKSVLGSPDPIKTENQSPRKSPSRVGEEKALVPEEGAPADAAEPGAGAAAPRRRSARAPQGVIASAPLESPSEAKPAEAETETVADEKSEEPTASSFVEVENQLEKMFAGLEEEPPAADTERRRTSKPAKRRRATGKGHRKAGAGEAPPRADRKPGRKKPAGSGGRQRARANEPPGRDAYDSGSNASSASRTRGPYIQIRGPRDSPLSVSVVNAGSSGAGGAPDDDCDAAHRARPPRAKHAVDGELRNGLRTRGLHCSTLSLRYDATTPDASWVCAFCERGPHAGAKDGSEPRALGDLFGPYALSTDCDEFRALDEPARRKLLPEARAPCAGSAPSAEVWMHEECALWTPGLIATGLRVWGLEAGVWGARGVRCPRCGRGGACVACTARGCPARSHVWCARAAHWRLDDEQFRALCPRHAQ